MVSANGIEGNLIYAASALLRDEIAVNGHADLHLDLLLAKGRSARSMPNHLKEQAGLTGVKAAQWTALCADPTALANRVKAPAAAPDRATPDRRGDQQRGWRAVCFASGRVVG